MATIYRRDNSAGFNGSITAAGDEPFSLTTHKPDLRWKRLAQIFPEPTQEAIRGCRCHRRVRALDGLQGASSHWRQAIDESGLDRLVGYPETRMVMGE